VGWLAQWQEMLMDSDQAIARPRQIYTGYDTRPYISVEDRDRTPKAAEVMAGV
jgi:citrate synthase